MLMLKVFEDDKSCTNPEKAYTAKRDWREILEYDFALRAVLPDPAVWPVEGRVPVVPEHPLVVRRARDAHTPEAFVPLGDRSPLAAIRIDECTAEGKDKHKAFAEFSLVVLNARLASARLGRDPLGSGRTIETLEFVFERAVMITWPEDGKKIVQLKAASSDFASPA
jgi:hypothetical protein